jgi:hypothetical protein
VPRDEYKALLRGRTLHPDATLFRPIEPEDLRATIMGILMQPKRKSGQV